MTFSRLHGRKAAERVIRHGRRWKGKTCTIHVLPGYPRNLTEPPKKPTVYVGTAASTKLHKSAVKRNRMRRRVREAFRKELKNHPNVPTVQLLLRPYFASLDAPYEVLVQDMTSFLSQLSRP